MIFLDLDDVLVDFSGGLVQFNIKNDTTFIHLPREQWTPFQIKLDRQVVDCMNEPGFFRGLPPKLGYKELWETANNLDKVKILTAWPKSCTDVPRVANEKFEWCYEQFKIGDKDFICCAREDKAKFSRQQTGPSVEDYYPNTLVDDMKANIDHWEREGGKGILYLNAKQAIEELKQYYV